VGRRGPFLARASLRLLFDPREVACRRRGARDDREHPPAPVLEQAVMRFFVVYEHMLHDCFGIADRVFSRRSMMGFLSKLALFTVSVGRAIFDHEEQLPLSI
jgi:hypothetical protein